MLLLLSLMSVVCLSAGMKEKNFINPVSRVEWFDQKFDHGNSSDTRRWKQQVLVWDGYLSATFDPLSPTFVIVGGEGPVQEFYDYNGLAFEMALQHKALVITPEHRYFGQSVPLLSPGSNSTVAAYLPDNLLKLTVPQALADYVAIINAIRQRYKLQGGPIISVGGSYPGELASFLRQMQAVDFSLASSAPVYYRVGFDGAPHEAPSGSFFEQTTKAFASSNPICPSLVQKAFQNMLQLDGQGSYGQAVLKRQLSLCKPYSSLDMLQLWIESAFASLVMSNYPYPTV